MRKLYKTLQIFTLLTGIIANASPPIEKHPVDNFDIGIPTSSSQKQFIFDLGLGASNPNLGVDTVLQGLNYNKNLLQFGDGLSSQKTFTANIGNGSTNPKIIWDNTNSTWSFSNDGTNFSAFGSGSGGASGIQLLTNGDFESGITLGWTNTGGTFAVATSGSNLLVGKKSATFTASGSGQSVQSSLYTIPNGLTGQSCAASMMYKGGDVGLTFEVVDGSSNILASQIIQTATNAQVISLPFVCPSSGTIQVKILSSAPAALIAFDQMFLGQNTLIAVSQSSWVGGLVASGGACTYTNPGSGGQTDFSDAGSCASNVTTVGSAGFVSSNGQITLANAPPGEYLVYFIGQCESGQINTNGDWVIYDGSTYSTQVNIQGSPSANLTVPCTLEGHFSYSTAGSRSWRLQGAGSVGKTFTAQQGEFASVYRFPSQSEIAVRPETINYLGDAWLSGANNTLAGTGSWSVVSANGNAMTNNGIATIQMLPPCSGTNPPSDATCSGGGSPEYGTVFNVPAASTVEVCVQFLHHWNTNGSTNDDTFRLVETPTANDSIVLQGGASQFGHAVGGTINIGSPQTLCEKFKFASAGQKAIRLQSYTTSGGGGLNNEIISDSSVGGRNFHISVKPVTQNVPAPVLTFQPVAFHVSGVPSGSPGNSFPGIAIFPKTGPYDFDTNNAYNVSTGFVTIPTPGLWEFTCQLYISSSTTVSQSWQYDAYLCKNDSTTCGGGNFLSLAQQWFTGSVATNIPGDPISTVRAIMNAGDTIACYGELNANARWEAGAYYQDYFEGHLVR